MFSVTRAFTCTLSLRQNTRPVVAVPVTRLKTRQSGLGRSRPRRELTWCSVARMYFPVAKHRVIGLPAQKVSTARLGQTRPDLILIVATARVVIQKSNGLKERHVKSSTDLTVMSPTRQLNTPRVIVALRAEFTVESKNII